MTQVNEIDVLRKDGYDFYVKDQVFKPHGINRFTIYWAEHNLNSRSPREYLEKMHAAGINSLRIVIPGELERGVEPQLGMYNAEFLQPVDDVFEIAADLGVYIIVCLFDYASFYAPLADDIWQKGIYSTKFDHPKDFFGSNELRKFEKRRLEFLVNHFGQYPNVFAWELMNEMNYMGKYFGDACEEVTMEWFDDMAQSLRMIDQAHLLTGSLWGGETWESLFSHPLNDIVQIHTYDEIENPTKIAENIQQYVTDGKKYSKPIVIGEFGSKETNPQRADFVKNALRAAQAERASAWLYCSIWDEFGDMNDELFEIYRQTASIN